jgi:hypothetical protein
LSDVVEPFMTAVRLMSMIAALACAVNAIELLAMRSSWSSHGVWREEILATEWGGWRVLLGAKGFLIVQAVQLVAAGVLATCGAFVPLHAGRSVAEPGVVSSTLASTLAGSTPVSTLAAGVAMVLVTTTVLAAIRFRATVNGGSDGMLFTVLLGLSIAWLPSVPMLVREGAVLYVAAQVTLSYARAGLVKVRERAWWRGDALAAFLALPAYGVPPWIPRHPVLLRVASIAVITFECTALAAWSNPQVAAIVIATALLFHIGAAFVFGLNRFLLAWSAALPALWCAANRVG